MYTNNLSGSWSPPQPLFFWDAEQFWNGNIDSAVDENGNWHVVYDYQNNSIKYISNVGGPYIIAEGEVFNSSLDVDPNGGLHVTYVDYGQETLIKCMYTTTAHLIAVNQWDGKSIKLQWSDRMGTVKIYRKMEGGNFEYIASRTLSFEDTVPEPGMEYTYVLRDNSGKNISNEVKVKAEVIVVLGRGYSLKKKDAVNDNYWKPEGHSGLVDVNEWFEQRGVSCWVPDQGYGPGEGLSGWKTISDNTDELETFINSKRTGDYKDAKINLVCHSMGGLVARNYAKQNPEIVNNIFTIQTPHTGTRLAEIGLLNPFNPATKFLTPFYLEFFFNKNVRNLGSTKLCSFWSTNFKEVYHDLGLKAGWAIISLDQRFRSGIIGAGSDGVVPKLSAIGQIRKRIFLTSLYGAAKPEVDIDGYNDTNLDHYSCYRHELTLQQIMDWMGLPYTQTLSMQMLLAASDSNEPNPVPMYLIAGFSGHFDNTTPITETVPICNSITAYFRAITSDANCHFILTDPCGTIYDPCYASGEPDVTYYSEDELFMYEVNSPILGTWTLNLSTTVAPPNSVDYGLTVFEDANIALYAYTDLGWANTDANILILARLTESNNPIINANVAAEIVLPDTNTVSAFLYDDGLHNDVNAGDGVYANIFTSTAQTGIYTGQVTATGNSIYGGFERTNPLSFTISAPDIDFAGDINDVGVDLNANALYDILKFTIPVDVYGPNEYLLTATLFDSNDNIIKLLTTGEVNLPAGPNNLTLQVAAEDIVKHDVNGPYTLSNIILSDANTSLTIAAHPDYNTAAYDLNDFEPLDSDYDGLWDITELSIGTDVNEPDSDSDGLTDYNEVAYDGNALTYNPANDLNPLMLDTDNDGMGDGWELLWGMDPLADDGAKDDDWEPDGLTNLQEYQNNTDPNNADTDADGMTDGWEVLYGFNPAYNDGDGYQDPDGDELVNWLEYKYGTEPNNPDTDGDTIQDGPDNCKADYNPDQSNMDGDDKGDECDCLPDLSNDGIVNLVDFALFGQHWLDGGCAGPDFCNARDFDKNGQVGFTDLDHFANRWLSDTTAP